jgi:hypothetical protein
MTPASTNGKPSSGAGSLGGQAADHHLRLAALDYQPIQFPPHPTAGERGMGHQRQALAGAVIHDGQEATAIGELVRHKVERPAVVGRHVTSMDALAPIARLRPPRRTASFLPDRAGTASCG